MLRNFLILSPRFPPINAPDHQRVRMALPYLEQFGWRPTVLAVRPEDVEGVHDPLLERSLPAGLQVERVRALPARWTRRLGVGSLSFRAGRGLARVGRELLQRDKFDLVFFSTTEFPLMALGPRWFRDYGVPYVLDFQDPWVNDYYERHPEMRPPGGKFKHGFVQWLARRLERKTLLDAAHVICVSPAYPKMFRQRYPSLREDVFSVLPFAAGESDFANLGSGLVKQTVFNPKDGRQHWVYAGACIPNMALAVRSFFYALNKCLESAPDLRCSLRVHFIGTSYAPKGRATGVVTPLAAEAGLSEVVSEVTDRIPYFETLQCLADADALFIPGSDDPGYTASKIYPYVLARKPLLAVFHEASSVVEVLEQTKAGKVVSFNSADSVESLGKRIASMGWLLRPSAAATDWTAFEPYTARAMTRRLCALFEQALAGAKD